MSWADGQRRASGLRQKASPSMKTLMSGLPMEHVRDYAFAFLVVPSDCSLSVYAWGHALTEGVCRHRDARENARQVGYAIIAVSIKVQRRCLRP